MTRARPFAILTDGDSGLVDALADALRNDGTDVVVLGERDLRSTGQIEGIAATVIDEHGVPSIVVNDLAAGSAGSALELDAADVTIHLERMLIAPFALSRVFASAMREGEGGTILSVTTADAFHAYPGRFLHALARSGIVAMTRALAVEWASYGIRVNALALGPHATGETALDDRKRARTPLGRGPRTGEIVAAARLLVDGRAPFITGQTIRVDGGWGAVDSASPGLRFP